MKNKIISGLIISALLSLPLLGFASDSSSQRGELCYDPLCSDGLIQGKTGLGDIDNPAVIAAAMINIGLSILGAFALILVVYAGFIWMLARGNEEEINKAKDTLRGAFIGLIIILASYSISYFVFYQLTRVTNAV